MKTENVLNEINCNITTYLVYLSPKNTLKTYSQSSAIMNVSQLNSILSLDFQLTVKAYLMIRSNFVLPYSFAQKQVLSHVLSKMFR